MLKRWDNRREAKKGSRGSESAPPVAEIGGRRLKTTRSALCDYLGFQIGSPTCSYCEAILQKQSGSEARPDGELKMNRQGNRKRCFLSKNSIRSSMAPVLSASFESTPMINAPNFRLPFDLAFCIKISAGSHSLSENCSSRAFFYSLKFL